MELCLSFIHQTPPHIPCTPPQSPSPAPSSYDSRASTPASLSGVPVSVIVKAERQPQQTFERARTLAERKMYDPDYSRLGSNCYWNCDDEESLSPSPVQFSCTDDQNLHPPAKNINTAQEQIFVDSKDTDREECFEESLVEKHAVPEQKFSESPSPNAPVTKALQSSNKLVAIAPKMPSLIPVNSGTSVIFAQINGSPTMIPTTSTGITHLIVTPGGNGASGSQVLHPISPLKAYTAVYLGAFSAILPILPIISYTPAATTLERPQHQNTPTTTSPPRTPTSTPTHP
ncbi:hypothetical protein E2C01_011883 [Portunus trituberculatus]|uniref:Uncharacterized protein n=1 Tax=Portunus trituberculatus TaxID=210409 RepID=A0A5B7DC43_PORTR|nr:hypothetical protein [Portunus trituberculatus]